MVDLKINFNIMKQVRYACDEKKKGFFWKEIKIKRDTHLLKLNNIRMV